MALLKAFTKVKQHLEKQLSQKSISLIKILFIAWLCLNCIHIINEEMADNYFVDLDVNGKLEELPQGTFEACVIRNVDFSKINLERYVFVDSTFENCNLSNTNVLNCGFQNVTFRYSKLLGVDFSSCNTFGLSFAFVGCQLEYCIFNELNLTKTEFEECKLSSVDFIQTNLKGSKFNLTSLDGCIFEYANLEQVDFRTAFNYSINPEENTMKGAKFSASQVAGLLGKYKISIED